jgi:hypothetical protein
VVTVPLPLVDPLSTVASMPSPSWPHGLQSLSNTSADSPRPLQNVCPQGGKQAESPFSFHPDAPLADNKPDFAMIMNYLDNVFPLLFYFYQPSNSERGRGWLLGLLLRAKSSYFTALAFSSLQQIKFVYKDDIVMKQNLSVSLDTYHLLALSELQKQLDYLPTVSGYKHLKISVEILACMMQLMSIEVFRETKKYKGWKGDWEVHLQAAGDILTVIGTHLRTSSSSSPLSTSNSGGELIQQPLEFDPTMTLLPLDEISGLDFFMKVYIWGDVFRCASIGVKSPDRNPFPYLTYLEEDRIRLDHIMGCRNWVMILLKEISNLETWKKDMQRRRNLSIPSLCSKAAGLEQRLYAGLKSARADQNSSTKFDQECNLVTHIYAQSAVIYLAVVVSGNSHLLPQVRSSVAKTLTSLKALPPHLLIRISWAYCVAGCMADETEKGEFRQLLILADKAGHKLGTLWDGLEIAEEVWMLRENSNILQTTDKCAWALAMDSLGSKILLI